MKLMDMDGGKAMQPLLQIERTLRRARLLAARTRPVKSINRTAILGGQWDSGDIVRQFRDGRGSFAQSAPYWNCDWHKEDETQ